MPTPLAIAMTSQNAARCGLPLRAVAGVWLIAYAVLAVGLPLLDSATDHSGRVAAHWEDASTSDCPAAHDTNCVACQFLAKGRALPAEAPVAHAAALSVGVAPEEREFRLASRSVSDGLSSRAPPTA